VLIVSCGLFDVERSYQFIEMKALFIQVSQVRSDGVMDCLLPSIIMKYRTDQGCPEFLML
jgi:hypothetical protein